MPQGDDRRQTRQRLLDAACEVFARKGFREAKVAEICREAGTNVAAVNYHYGGKAALYVAAWRHSFQKLAPVPGVEVEMEAAASPPERLQRHIHHLIREFSDQGRVGQLNRLYLMELVNPTGLIDDTWEELVEPRRRKLLAIVRDLVGPEADDETVRFCEMSVINQCRIFLTVSRPALTTLVGQPLTPEVIERMAAHITRFSLAGIRGIGGAPLSGLEGE